MASTSSGATTSSAREDGRVANQLRPLACSRGLLNRADGSARWCFNDTNVVVGVFGPRHGGMGRKEDPQRATLDVAWTPKSGLPGQAERHAEAVLRRTLESAVLSSLLPRTRVSVVVQVVHDDGSLLACALNAACVALAHAGIPMSHMISAMECCVDSNGAILLDPTKQEERSATATMLAVFPNRTLKISPTSESETMAGRDEDSMVTCDMTGRMEVPTLMTAVSACRAACLKIDEVMRASTERAFQSAG